MPPEIYGCLAVAEKHEKALKDIKWKFYNRHKSTNRRLEAKHKSKVQKLISKAVKYLNNRKETL